MKTNMGVILVLFLFFNLGAVSYDPSTITLTALEVNSASEIEFAIEQATAIGNRPGKVILDGSQGEFLYVSDDRSINIAYPNLTIAGVNGATINHCDDGIFLESVAHNVTIEGITFNCDFSPYDSNGIDAFWVEEATAITIRDNTFHTFAAAINVRNGSQWKIMNNNLTVADPVAQVINLNNTSGSKVMGNILYGGTGVTLTQASGNQVKGNIFFVPMAGIYFSEAHDNQVVNNTINGIYVEDAYPFFALQMDFGTVRNIIVNNTATCEPGIECYLYFNAETDFMQTNHIVNNAIE